MVSTVVICFMFSAGMPALYIVGFLFFSVTYVVNKVGIISYYLKSTTMSNSISQTASTIMFLSVPIHMIFGLLMLTDPNLLFLKDHTTRDLKIF